MTSSEEALVEAAMALRAQVPDLWQHFVMAVQSHAIEQTTKMAECDPAMLQRAQGMAIAIRDLSRLLLNAPDHHQKIRNKMAYGRST